MGEFSRIIMGIGIYSAVMTGIFLPPALLIDKHRGDYEEKVKQQLSVVDKAFSAIAGKDRIVSLQESREFLDFIGYEKPIGENEAVYLRFRSPDNIEVVIGGDLQNNGGILSGSTAYSGRVTMPVDISDLERYVASRAEANL